jgi:hypothetical protein
VDLDDELQQRLETLAGEAWPEVWAVLVENPKACLEKIRTVRRRATRRPGILEALQTRRSGDPTPLARVEIN